MELDYEPLIDVHSPLKLCKSQRIADAAFEFAKFKGVFSNRWSYEEAQQAWLDFVENTLYPLYERYGASPELFVDELHKLLRGTSKYATNQYSLVHYFMNPNKPLNCYGSTMLMAACLECVGLFPGTVQIILTQYPNGHAYLLLPNDIVFETTLPADVPYRKKIRFRSEVHAMHPYAINDIDEAISSLLSVCTTRTDEPEQVRAVSTIPTFANAFASSANPLINAEAMLLHLSFDELVQALTPPYDYSTNFFSTYMNLARILKSKDISPNAPNALEQARARTTVISRLLYDYLPDFEAQHEQQRGRGFDPKIYLSSATLNNNDTTQNTDFFLLLNSPYVEDRELAAQYRNIAERVLGETIDMHPIVTRGMAKLFPAFSASTDYYSKFSRPRQ